MTDNKLFNLFKTETGSYIKSMENSLLEIQPDSPDNRLINEIYRSAHTIKGSASIMQCDIIKDIVHPMETILQSIIDTEICLSDDLIDIFLQACDLIKVIINDLPKTQKHKKHKLMLCNELKKYINKAKKQTRATKKKLLKNNSKHSEKITETPNNYIVFSSSKTLFAIPLYLIKEVLNNIKIKPIPFMETCLLGIANWYNNIVPVIDFSKRFDLTQNDSSEYGFIILKSSDSFLGIKVDSLDDIIDSSKEIVWSPEEDLKFWSFCDAYCKIKDKIIHLITMEILFSRETLEVN